MANSFDEFARSISEEVTCAICLEELKEPKMLLCSHNVCRQCLELMSRNKNLIDIVCPVCRKPTPIPKGGVRCLPTNAAIIRVVEATLARKARIEIQESLLTEKPMVELLAKKISDLDKPLRVLKEIQEKADKLVNVIRNQEANLCREVEEFYGRKCETIDGEKSDLDKLHSSASKCVQEAETILKQRWPDPTKTINAAKALKEQIEKITELDLNRDTSTLEDLEFKMNAEANIRGILKDETFGKLFTSASNKAALGDDSILQARATTESKSDMMSESLRGASKTPSKTQSTMTTRSQVRDIAANNSELVMSEPSKHLKLNLVPFVTGENYCDFCALAANLICKTCLKTICDKCKHVYTQDLCPPTKRDHQFENINEQSPSTNKAADKDSSSSWSCERCTFLNSSRNRICAVCATSRGVNQVALPKNGRKCHSCTYANEKGATICKMCHCTLGLDNPESYI
ncbi:tripartite motif-containing protein 2-like [Actinia tenebrosa]|uniref:RanBP-type and C3HC4-type zinc finger-containing protein 1 n=1 Tax=Actinia tenebrosa TaxID=6105 RepID=A0A6P8I9X3_ACTTE|nr:tripartite motif-containing protein 2-like [Actinia tenebrosa]